MKPKCGKPEPALAKGADAAPMVEHSLSQFRGDKGGLCSLQGYMYKDSQRAERVHSG